MRGCLYPLRHIFFSDTSLAIAKWTYLPARIAFYAPVKMLNPKIPSLCAGFFIQIFYLVKHHSCRLIRRFKTWLIADNKICYMRISHITVMALGRHNLRLQFAFPEFLLIHNTIADHAKNYHIFSFYLAL